ncbi:MAG: hypothetical protein U0T83_09270 [Bacteriovoracaceae bacterium]
MTEAPKNKRPFGIILIMIVEFLVLLPALVQIINYNAPAVLMGLNVMNIFVGIFNLALTVTFLYCLFKNSYLIVMQSILGIEALNKILFWVVLASSPIESLIKLANLPMNPDLIAKAPVIKGAIVIVGICSIFPQVLFSLYLWYQREFFKPKSNQ